MCSMLVFNHCFLFVLTLWLMLWGKHRLSEKSSYSRFVWEAEVSFVCRKTRSSDEVAEVSFVLSLSLMSLNKEVPQSAAFLFKFLRMLAKFSKVQSWNITFLSSLFPYSFSYVSVWCRIHISVETFFHSSTLCYSTLCCNVESKA